MTFWILAALLTALPLGLALAPLRRGHKTLAWAVIGLTPLAALALYLLTGNPGLAQ